MSAELSEGQVRELKHTLEKQYRELREEIRQELLNYDNEQYLELAGRVHDMEDESVADLLVDLNLAAVDRHIHALQSVDAALLRIGTDEYGACVDCESPIGYSRLKVNPAASRCLECQEKFERTHLRGR
jgi:RNA polymerase-binding protein DksA